MVVPISIGFCWNPINPIHSGWGILIQCLFLKSTVVFFNTNTVSVKVKSAAFPIRTCFLKNSSAGHQLAGKSPLRYEFPIEKISYFRCWTWGFPKPPLAQPLSRRKSPRVLMPMASLEHPDTRIAYRPGTSQPQPMGRN